MTTEADSVQALVEGRLEAERGPFIIDGPNGRKFIATPNGDYCWATQEIMPRPNEGEVFLPKFVTQAARLQDANSMVEYVNRFKNFDSALFADIDASVIHAIIDYHKMPMANVPDNPNTGGAKGTGVSNDHEAKAQHGKHTATLTVPFSIEWQTWKAIDGRLMKHVDFATFLEENQQDIQPLAPIRNADGSPNEDAPTSLLELIRELQIKSSFGATSAVRSGDYTNIEFQKGDDISTKKNVALPLSFGLQIPVYFNEISVPMVAFMRRKIEDGALSLGIKLQRPEEVRQQEFHRIVGNVAQAVNLTTLYGKPA